MTLHIADPRVVEKIERLARQRGLTELELIERAIDKVEAERPDEATWARYRELLARMDAIPEVADPVDPLAWDENGLPI